MEAELRRAGYRVIGPIGSGGFGAVTLVEDPAGKRLAFKAVHPELGPEMAVRLADEAKLLRALSSPNLPVFFGEIGTPESGRYGVLLEYVEGDTLFDLLGRAPDLRGRLGLLRAVIPGVAAALRIMHALGAVHRDLKPENIMVRRREGSGVLLDLGLARTPAMPVRTATGFLVGTPGYMAPEQLGGDRAAAVAPAVDLYQLAMTVARSLDGSFASDEVGDFEALARRIREDRRYSLPASVSVPDSVTRCLDSILVRDHTSRPEVSIGLDVLVDSLRRGGARALEQPEDSSKEAVRRKEDPRAALRKAHPDESWRRPGSRLLVGCALFLGGALGTFAPTLTRSEVPPDMKRLPKPEPVDPGRIDTSALAQSSRAELLSLLAVQEDSYRNSVFSGSDDDLRVWGLRSRSKAPVYDWVRDELRLPHLSLLRDRIESSGVEIPLASLRSVRQSYVAVGLGDPLVGFGVLQRDAEQDAVGFESVDAAVLSWVRRFGIEERWRKLAVSHGPALAKVRQSFLALANRHERLSDLAGKDVLTEEDSKEWESLAGDFSKAYRVNAIALAEAPSAAGFILDLSFVEMVLFGALYRSNALYRRFAWELNRPAGTPMELVHRGLLVTTSAQSGGVEAIRSMGLISEARGVVGFTLRSMRQELVPDLRIRDYLPFSTLKFALLDREEAALLIQANANLDYFTSIDAPRLVRISGEVFRAIASSPEGSKREADLLRRFDDVFPEQLQLQGEDVPLTEFYTGLLEEARKLRATIK